MTEQREQYDADPFGFVDGVLGSVAVDIVGLEERIEALELRQNLVESPVMLRIADALETLATAMEALSGCVEEVGTGTESGWQWSHFNVNPVRGS